MDCTFQEMDLTRDFVPSFFNVKVSGLSIVKLKIYSCLSILYWYILKA